jgi:hypothetical protein
LAPLCSIQAPHCVDATDFSQFMGPPGTTAAFATVIAGGLNP